MCKIYFMNLFAQITIALIALLHIYILYMEMFAWTTLGRRTFGGYSKEFFHKTKSMAANQGLYNGFLAAGLIWSLLIADVNWSNNVALFFLACVAIAGVFGAFSADKKIVLFQTLPAVIGMILVLLDL